MSDESTALLRDLATQVRGLMTLRRQSAHHLPNCPVGMWLNGHTSPHGSPCSSRCATLRALLERADAHLAATTERQGELKEAG